MAGCSTTELLPHNSYYYSKHIFHCKVFCRNKFILGYSSLRILERKTDSNPRPHHAGCSTTELLPRQQYYYSKYIFLAIPFIKKDKFILVQKATFVISSWAKTDSNPRPHHGKVMFYHWTISWYKSIIAKIILFANTFEKYYYLFLSVNLVIVPN